MFDKTIELLKLSENKKSDENALFHLYKIIELLTSEKSKESKENALFRLYKIAEGLYNIEAISLKEFEIIEKEINKLSSIPFEDSEETKYLDDILRLVLDDNDAVVFDDQYMSLTDVGQVAYDRLWTIIDCLDVDTDKTMSVIDYIIRFE